MLRPDPPSNSELYEDEINTRKEAIESIVSETKWLVELAAFLGLNTAGLAVFAILLRRLFEAGPSVRLLCGIAIISALSWMMFWRANRAIQLGGEIILIKVRAICRVPCDIEYRHTIFNAAWRALMVAVQMAAMWGAVLVLEEMLKDSKLIG